MFQDKVKDYQFEKHLKSYAETAFLRKRLVSGIKGRRSVKVMKKLLLCVLIFSLTTPTFAESIKERLRKTREKEKMGLEKNTTSNNSKLRSKQKKQETYDPYKKEDDAVIQELQKSVDKSLTDMKRSEKGMVNGFGETTGNIISNTEEILKGKSLEDINRINAKMERQFEEMKKKDKKERNERTEKMLEDMRKDSKQWQEQNKGKKMSVEKIYGK